jgi:hypothetical protein
MADGYHVELPALEDAAAGINETLSELKAHRVSDLDADPATFGHDGLASTLTDFGDRWELGVEHLATDAQQVSARLSQCVQAYLMADRTAADNMSAILNGTGPDPAAR